MNILIVNRALGTLFGGGESFDANAARHLQQRGHQVTLLTGRPIWMRPKNTFPELNVVYLRSPELRRFAYATEKLHSKISAAFYHLDNLLFEESVCRWIAKQPRGRFDVVQCCSLFRLPAWLLKHCDQPSVSWLPGPPSGVIRRQLPSLCRHNNFGLFTHGSPAWSLDKMGFDRDKEYTVIEPGVELAIIDAVEVDRCAVRTALGIGSDTFLGVTTARLVPVKNHSLLLEAIATAKSRGIIWHWLIIGNGPLEQSLKILTESLGIAAQVHFLGYQPQAEVHRWLGAADLFALTSSYENFSIATLEAMAHRLPVIGTQVGYLQHLISDTGAGRVVPPDQPELLADALTEMADLQIRQQLGANGRAFAERLDWPMIAAKLESCYQRAIAGE
jgi:glycosyltransferase involved in cell wall biosynthesis